MNTQAPPLPDTGHDDAANCEDAFDAVARRLDALLQTTGQATDVSTRPTGGPVAQPRPSSVLHSTAEPEMMGTTAPIVAQPALAIDTPGPGPVDTDHAATPATAQPPAPAESGEPIGDMTEALLDLGSPRQADETNHDVPAPAPLPAPPAADTGIDPDAGDPSPMDLDAEIEALLAEQPIDPEVLGAAEEIAQRDAQAAEQNKDAMRLRAAQAAELLEALDGDATPTEDDITSEIDSLLAAAEDTPITPAASADNDTPAADPTIDQLDQILAAEAQDDDDLELAGSFFSTDAIATGDTTGQGETLDLGDGLTGSFAANDSQNATPDIFPIDRADTHPVPEPGSDIDLDAPLAWWHRIDWRHLMEIAEAVARRACWLINWPARRFLTAEWRATMGYLALLQVAGAAAVWLFLVIL